MDYSFDVRWLSPDPTGGDVMHPQSLNRYAYVSNNPATLDDPLGLFKEDPMCSDASYAISHADCSGEGLGCNPLVSYVCNLEVLCQQFGYCGGGTVGGGGAPAPPSPPPAGQPPLAGGAGAMGNAMFGGLITCTNAQVTIGGVQYPIGPTTCGLTPFGVLGLWGGTFASNLLSAQSLATTWNSLVASNGCGNLLFTTFGNDLLPVPTEPSPTDLAEPAAHFFSALTFNRALDYAASRGLTYPFQSSVFRGLIQTSEGIGESAPELTVGVAAVDALYRASSAGLAGGCE